ncbi:Non-specific serine/threonine protein kinase [Abeliophyllum distichum]|uniref:Non-specific serine/threonine protein kinase n=1 Tax=Abeliophyllum distichum TaxID=126358 RepID=A0ABD1QE42_9LAMI
MNVGGDSSTKWVKFDQEIDTRVACEVQYEENSLRAPEQNTVSKSLETVINKSDLHGRPDKPIFIGNGSETSQIIVTSIGGRNGQPKQQCLICQSVWLALVPLELYIRLYAWKRENLLL